MLLLYRRCLFVQLRTAPLVANGQTLINPERRLYAVSMPLFHPIRPTPGARGPSVAGRVAKSVGVWSQRVITPLVMMPTVSWLADFSYAFSGGGGADSETSGLSPVGVGAGAVNRVRLDKGKQAIPGLKWAAAVAAIGVAAGSGHAVLQGAIGPQEAAALTRSGARFAGGTFAGDFTGRVYSRLDRSSGPETPERDTTKLPRSLPAGGTRSSLSEGKRALNERAVRRMSRMNP